MFSSSPFPELPLSPNAFHPPNLFFDNEKDCICFNNTGDPFISNGCFFHSPPPVKQDFVSSQQQQQFSEGGPVLSESCEGLLDSVIASCSKSENKSAASNGKIYTAGGLRDRRVRLSIETSRKFFCVQDLLGFDKASKTLDWLFTKSKKAITELVDEADHVEVYQSKADFLESIKDDLDEGEVFGKKEKSVMKWSDDKMTQSRTIARARARERTREKMKTKKAS